MPDNTDSSLILGELRGQMREMVHNLNNLSTKFDSLSREVMTFAAIAQDIGALKSKIEALEAEKNQNDGAKGVMRMLLKSPALGWLVGAVITAWAVLTGKVHI